MATAQANQSPRSLGENAMAWPSKVKAYIEELRAEMRKVSWPNARQVQGTTVVVIVSVFGFALYFFVVDSIFNQTITRLFDTLTK